MSLLIRWILNTLALFVVVTFVPNFSYRGWVSLAIAALVLGLLNAIVRPILFVLTLPITVVTLGLFLLVLNAIMLELTAWLVPGFDINKTMSKPGTSLMAISGSHRCPRLSHARRSAPASRFAPSAGRVSVFGRGA